MGGQERVNLPSLEGTRGKGTPEGQVPVTGKGETVERRCEDRGACSKLAWHSRGKGGAVRSWEAGNVGSENEIYSTIWTAAPQDGASGKEH